MKLSTTAGRKTLLVGVAMFAAATFVSEALADSATKVDPTLSQYSKVPGISGNLNSVGSDTLNNLMTLWAEKFNQHYPGVKIQIEGKGSSTAPPALIEGTAQLGPMSREMKATEIDAFEKEFGYKPTAFKVAVDALAIFTNKDNPVNGLTLAQVDAIFSSTRNSGYPKDIATWGQLGLTGAWASKPISLYGRNSASGTYGVFKKQILGNGDFKNTVKEQPGSASVVQGITVDLYGLGYSGIGYSTSGVRAVPLATEEGEPFIEATAENSYTGEYPMARFLFIYVNKKPNQPLNPMIKEFIKLIYSEEGQQIVVKDGYFPITAAVAEEQMGQL